RAGDYFSGVSNGITDIGKFLEQDPDIISEYAYADKAAKIPTKGQFYWGFFLTIFVFSFIRKWTQKVKKEKRKSRAFVGALFFAGIVLLIVWIIFSAAFIIALILGALSMLFSFPLFLANAVASSGISTFGGWGSGGGFGSGGGGFGGFGGGGFGGGGSGGSW
ncbi:hypothetical protein HC823_00750, partial [Candidatus Gracilibacteria bacterium]|nr:hypothetical protein [Candidatus Gracilibacteria bacterium]